MDDEAKLKRARRVLLAFRVIFYPGAALFLFFLLARPGSGEEKPVLISGMTGQEYRFAAKTKSGHVRWFATTVRTTCPSGQSNDWDWESDFYSTLFEWSGPRLRVRDARRDGAYSWVVTVRAQSRKHQSLDGTIELTFTQNGEICPSGPIHFWARADR